MIYNFNSFTEKHKSRYETIINTYKSLFNSSVLIGDYVTLCADQTNEFGVLDEGSELSQLIAEKFLTPEQFHGVDTEPRVIERNSKIGIANWYGDDVYSFIFKNVRKMKMTCINLDTVFYNKRRASNLLSDVLVLLKNNTEGQCMVTLNVMVNNCYETHKITDELIAEQEMNLIKELETNRSYKSAVKGGWNMLDQCYIYSSTNNTVMCTYIFYREA